MQDIKAVRVLPMVSDLNTEFPDCTTIADVQEKFLLNDLPFRSECRYYVRKRGIKCKEGSIILFQCNAHIIATAMLIRTGEDRIHGKYLLLDRTSIRVFDPVGAGTILSIWPDEFKNFSHVRWDLRPTGYYKLLQHLHSIRQPQFLEHREGSVLAIHWNETEAVGFTDLIPTNWLSHEGMLPEKVHSTVGPQGWRKEAKCNVLVAGPVVQLDYEVFDKFNNDNEMDLGCMQIHFQTEHRDAVKQVYWKGAQETCFSKVDTTIALEAIVLPPPPSGNLAPSEKTATINVKERSNLIKHWVQKNANGRCEGCQQPAPFANHEGVPFLEVHHMLPLAGTGRDTTDNAVALCPNCHRRCHHSSDRDVFIDSIYTNVSRLVRE